VIDGTVFIGSGDSKLHALDAATNPFKSVPPYLAGGLQ